MMVAVGFNLRIGMTRGSFVAERRRNASRRRHTSLWRPMAWRWFHRRSAARWFGVMADRGLKPTARIVELDQSAAGSISRRALAPVLSRDEAVILLSPIKPGLAPCG